MSLLLVFHDHNRACVASDARTTVFENGQPRPGAEDAPKFAIVGNFIVAATGPSDCCYRLTKTYERLAQAEPHFTIGNWGRHLTMFAREIYGSRKHVAGMDPRFEGFQAAVIGFDGDLHKIRAFTVEAPSFTLIETTQNEHNRLFAFGAYEDEDVSFLNNLTARMRFAHQRQLGWVAHHLRDGIDSLAQKRPATIGSAAYFAALNRDAISHLPEGFPGLPQLATHHASILKTDALLGPGRMYVGAITTPAAGAGPTVGFADGGGGAQVGMVNYLLFQNAVQSAAAGNGASANLNKMIDGDPTTFGTLSLSGNSGTNLVNVVLSGLAGVVRSFAGYVLQVRWAVPTNTLNAGVGCFAINFSYQNAVVSNIIALNAGSTAGVTVTNFPLPLGLNPGQIGIQIAAAVLATTTSGSLTAEIFDCSLVAIE